MNTPLSSQSSSSQSLWDFALAFYAQPPVAEACLQLQDEYQANVCLMIGLHWLDVRVQRITDEQLFALNDYIKNWMDDVVMPLRSLRRELKIPFKNFAQDDVQEQLRTVIKQAELLAEKKLLVEIECWINSQTNSAQGTDNLERYLLQLGSPDYLIKLLLSK
jgi:uncharacterized protein (TIGR02444 family)